MRKKMRHSGNLNKVVVETELYVALGTGQNWHHWDPDLMAPGAIKTRIKHHCIHQEHLVVSAKMEVSPRVSQHSDAI